MSYERRNQNTTSYDESVMTAMAVVPQNNNKNVTTMYHPVIEGVNASGSNVACLNKCMKIPSNFTMEDGTEILLVNMASRGTMIMYRYQINAHGHLVKVDSVRTPFDVKQYRMQKPVSGVIRIYCNTITGTDFTLSGQVSALALYDLPQPTPNYEDLAKYSIMPTFSRINTSLEDGVVLVMLPSPWDFKVPAIIDHGKEYVTVAEATSQEPIASGSCAVPANGMNPPENWNKVEVVSGFYACGSRLYFEFTGEMGKIVNIGCTFFNGNNTMTTDLAVADFTNSTLCTAFIDVPEDYDTVRLAIGSADARPSMLGYSVYTMDPMTYLDSDLKHLVYIQGSLSPKNIVVSGELRKQIVPLTEYIPVTEMRLPIPYDPKVFEAFAILAQMPDYGLVLKRSEYEKLGLITLDNVAAVASGECGIADYWKIVVAALKKAGIKPAQLGKKLLDAGMKYGRNLLDYAESQGFAEDTPEEMCTLRFGTCSDASEDSTTLDFDGLEEDFQTSPERGAVEIHQKESMEIWIPFTPEDNTQPMGFIRMEESQTTTQNMDIVNKEVLNNSEMLKDFKNKVKMIKNGKMKVCINKSKQKKHLSCPQMVLIQTINKNEMEKSRKSIHSGKLMVPRLKYHQNEQQPPTVGRNVGNCGSRKGQCMDGSESMNTMDFGGLEVDDVGAPIMDTGSEVAKEEKQKDEIAMKHKIAKENAKDTKFEKADVKPAEVVIDKRYIPAIARRAKNGLSVSEEEYKAMALFKMNGGWKQYVSNLYASTEQGRLEWKKVIKEGNVESKEKSEVVRQNMVVADPSKKMFQPFIVQVDKSAVMATIILYFTEDMPTGDYTQYGGLYENLCILMDSRMKTKVFGITTFTANNDPYHTDGADICELLNGTSQWNALFSQLSKNYKAARKGAKLYIVLDFDVALDALEGGSFIGALDCCMFGECPFIFPEYTLCYFDGISWPTLVGKDFKQVIFDPTVAASFLPQWWPTSLPISIWYETPKSFASWKQVAVAKPIPFSAQLAANITSNPILAGPFERSWLFRFSPPQICKVKADYDEQYFNRLIRRLGEYEAPSEQAKKRFDENLNSAKTLINKMADAKWKAMASIIQPHEAIFFDAAMNGMVRYYRGALGTLNSLLRRVDSAEFYKIYNKIKQFEMYMAKKGLDPTTLTETQISQHKKDFAKSRNPTGVKKSKDQKKQDQRSKSEFLIKQFKEGEKPKIITYGADQPA